jgi:type I restriction enzyme, S subunit
LLIDEAPYIAHQVKALGKGSIMHGLNSEIVRGLAIALPPCNEQLAMLSFLDCEVGRLDALVAEQQRLIELLKEKRQAVISHAVTKGLNTDVPMKDSGIKWLGDIPVHWDLFPLKRDLTLLTSGSRGWAEHYADEGDLFIRIGNLTREGIELDLSDIQQVNVPIGTEGARTQVQTDDLLFSITAFLGSVAVVPHGIESAYVSQHVALARLRRDKLISRWVAYTTLSALGKAYFGEQGYGGTKIQLSLDDVANLPLTVPPKDEQRLIVSYLDCEIIKFDALITEATCIIDLLQERRTALISAAVTGKIDVRGMVRD